MRRKVSGCVGCQLPCIGSSCPYFEVVELICDKCKCEVEKLYWVDGEQYCEDCLLEEFEEVDPDEEDVPDWSDDDVDVD